MKISAYAASVVAALCLALAGCSADDEPGASSPTPTPSSTVTSDATPAPPELPAAATKKTAAGAEAFVKYYWAVVDYSQESGDVGPLKTLSLSSCEFCSGGIASIEKAAADGARFENEPTKVSTSRYPLDVQGGITTVAIDLRVVFSRATLEYGKNDDRNRVMDAHSGRYKALAAWSLRDESWRLAHLEDMS